jgi:hypothetical protein
MPSHSRQDDVAAAFNPAVSSVSGLYVSGHFDACDADSGQVKRDAQCKSAASSRKSNKPNKTNNQ